LANGLPLFCGYRPFRAGPFGLQKGIFAGGILSNTWRVNKVDVCEEHQQLVTDMAVIKRDLKENTRITQEILTSLKGNGAPGLRTEIELNKSAIRRAWWWLGSISAMLLAVLGWALRKMI